MAYNKYQINESIKIQLQSISNTKSRRAKSYLAMVGYAAKVLAHDCSHSDIHGPQDD